MTSCFYTTCTHSYCVNFIINLISPLLHCTESIGYSRVHQPIMLFITTRIFPLCYSEFLTSCCSQYLTQILYNGWAFITHVIRVNSSNLSTYGFMPYPQLNTIFLLCASVLFLSYQPAGVSVFAAAEKKGLVRLVVRSTIVLVTLHNVGSAEDCATACGSTFGCSTSNWDENTYACTLYASGRG